MERFANDILYLNSCLFGATTCSLGCEIWHGCSESPGLTATIAFNPPAWAHDHASSDFASFDAGVYRNYLTFFVDFDVGAGAA